MSIVAWLAVVASLVYLFFAIKNKPVCFIFGIISSLLWAYESYFVYYLKFDGLLQLFYVIMSAVGIYRWLHGGADSEEKPISRYPLSKHLLVIGIGACLFAAMVYGSQYYEVIAKPRLDAFTTVYFVIGTLLLVDRELNSWLYLVLCNIIMIYVYLTTGASLFAGMMAVYTVFGMVGYFNWRKLSADVNTDMSFTDSGINT